MQKFFFQKLFCLFPSMRQVFMCQLTSSIVKMLICLVQALLLQTLGIFKNKAYQPAQKKPQQNKPATTKKQLKPPKTMTVFATPYTCRCRGSSQISDYSQLLFQFILAFSWKSLQGECHLILVIPFWFVGFCNILCSCLKLQQVILRSYSGMGTRTVSPLVIRDGQSPCSCCPEAFSCLIAIFMQWLSAECTESWEAFCS